MAAQPTDPLEQSPDVQAMVKNAVDYFVSVQNIEKIWKGSDPALAKLVEILIGGLIGVVGTVGAEFAKAIVNAEDIAEPAFRRLANTALKDITGIDANIDNRSGGRDGRSGAARNIGSGILAALTGISGGGGTGGGTLAPSTKAAEDYLSFVVQMSLEGWLTGLMGEMMTLGQVENLGDLDDALANSLGLARTSRAVMRPFINTTVALPAQWQMNKLYRPELLSASLAVKLYNRKRWTKAQLMEELQRQGFSDDRIEALIQDAEQKPSLALVLKALQLEYVTAADVRTYLAETGYPEIAANFIIEMQEVEAISDYQRELADAAAAAFVARRIQPGRFYQLLSDSGIPSRDMARVRELAELKRAINVKTLSESDAEEAAKRLLISVQQYRELLRDNGYNEDAIHVKELLLRSDIKGAEQKKRADDERALALAAEKARKAAEMAERKRLLEEERAVTEPSLAQVERFVTRGRWDFAQYEAFLRAEKYDSATIAALLADAEQARAEYIARQEEREEAARRSATRSIGLATLEAAVLRGAADIGVYRRRLESDKYSAADTATLIAMLQDRIAERDELEKRRREAEERSNDKGLSVAQFEQSVLRGITSLSDLEAFLLSQGYSPFDSSVIVQLTSAKLADQAAAAERRAMVEVEAAARKVPLADIRRAVLAGVRTMADYRNALIDARVGADDRELLEALLQSEIEARASAQQRRDDIARERLEKGLSLPQLERAVVIGAATVEQYQQELADEGYDADSIDTLTALLIDRIQETQRARQRRDELDARAVADTVAPADVAQAVTAGIKTAQDYFFAHLSNGNSEADAQQLTQLLELELAEARDARATRTTIATKLADEGFNLGAVAAAVRAGTATLDDYAAAVSARGYTPAEVTTVAALLEREILEAEAAAAALDEATEGDKTRQISVSQFEQAVVAGARTIPEYVTFLESLKFSLAAQSSLVSLLLQRLDKNAGVM